MSPQNQNCTSEGVVRYIRSHKQGLQVSIHSIGNAAGSFACGWWGRKELVPLDHWGTWIKHHLVSPFVGALPFDGGKGSKKLSMRWKTRPIRWCYLNFHQETWKAHCGILEKRGIKPYFLLFKPFATAAEWKAGTPLRHPSWTVIQPHHIPDLFLGDRECFAYDTVSWKFFVGTFGTHLSQVRLEICLVGLRAMDSRKRWPKGAKVRWNQRLDFLWHKEMRFRPSTCGVE